MYMPKTRVRNIRSFMIKKNKKASGLLPNFSCSRARGTEYTRTGGPSGEGECSSGSFRYSSSGIKIMVFRDLQILQEFAVSNDRGQAQNIPFHPHNAQFEVQELCGHVQG